MKTTVHKKINFENMLVDMNMKAAIAFGIVLIGFLLLYIAWFK
jgi:hypothetical protein